jgi:hypothetical protein
MELERGRVKGLPTPYYLSVAVGDRSFFYGGGGGGGLAPKRKGWVNKVLAE